MIIALFVHNIRIMKHRFII